MHRRRPWIAVGATALVVGLVSYPVIQQISKSESWLQVYRGGHLIGFVPNRTDIQSQMQRLAAGFDVDLHLSPVRTVVPSSYQWKRIVKLPTPASAIELNGRPIVYTPSEKAAKGVLKMVMQSLTLTLPDAVAKHSNFIGTVKVTKVTVPVANILQPTAAERFLLNVSSANGIASRSSSPAFTNHFAQFRVNFHPLISVESTTKQTEIVSIHHAVSYKKNPDMVEGQTQVLQSGRDGKAKETVRMTYVNGKQHAEKILKRTVLAPAKTEVVEEGTNSGVAVGNWIWPTVGDTITSPFGWRDLDGVHEFHPGIDIGVPIGTPIYATNDGTVISAGWNTGGYGNWVEIDNGNGITTVFGHMSKVVATDGEIVHKGEVIGYSGDTGDATGPHLHYEVRVDGTAVPPMKYT